MFLIKKRNTISIYLIPISILRPKYKGFYGPANKSKYLLINSIINKTIFSKNFIALIFGALIRQKYKNHASKLRYPETTNAK